eukprot:COSAG01_NODE_5655_length_4115_cov_4.372330_6_plen_112_part_01
MEISFRRSMILQQISYCCRMGFSGDLFLRVVWVRGTQRHSRRPNDGQLMVANTSQEGCRRRRRVRWAVTTDSRPHQRRSCAWCMLAQVAMAHFAPRGPVLLWAQEGASFDVG